MPIVRDSLTVQTRAALELVDLTARLQEWVAGTGVRDGLLTVTSPHTTARITRNERESGLQRDIVRFLEALAPADGSYAHNLDPVDGRANAHAHLLGMLMPASESIPVADGILVLGRWQSVFLVELDGPRTQRSVHLQLLAP